MTVTTKNQGNPSSSMSIEEFLCELEKENIQFNIKDNDIRSIYILDKYGHGCCPILAFFNKKLGINNCGANSFYKKYASYFGISADDANAIIDGADAVDRPTYDPKNMFIRDRLLKLCI